MGAPPPVRVSERAAVVAFAGYVTHVLQRQLNLRERVTVAETLQRAMPATAPVCGARAGVEPAT